MSRHRGKPLLSAALLTGVGLLFEGKLPAAEAAFRDAIRLNGTNPRYHVRLGLVLTEQGKVAEAETAFREAVRLDPRAAMLHALLGEALLSQNKRAEAEAVYQEALRLDARSAAYRRTLEQRLAARVAGSESPGGVGGGPAGPAGNRAGVGAGPVRPPSGGPGGGGPTRPPGGGLAVEPPVIVNPSGGPAQPPVASEYISYRNVGAYRISNLKHRISVMDGDVETCRRACNELADCKGFSISKGGAQSYCQFFNLTVRQAQAEGLFKPQGNFDYYEKVSGPAGEVQLPVTASPPAGGAIVALQNGGTGPSFEATNYRGKFFASTPSGTITEICTWGQRTGTSVTVEVKAEPDAAPAAFQETLAISNANTWNCKAVAHAWSAPSLFIYKVDGSAVGYDRSEPYDSRYSSNRGASWSADRVRRGYRVLISSGGGRRPALWLQVGAAAPEQAPQVERRGVPVADAFLPDRVLIDCLHREGDFDELFALGGHSIGLRLEWLPDLHLELRLAPIGAIRKIIVAHRVGHSQP